MKVFVYGTLRQGQPNHSLLEEGGARFISPAKTWDGYTMIHLGGFPGVVAAGPYIIKGELYEVPETTVANVLDPLEGHPTFYRRRRIDTIDVDGNDVVAETYLLSRDWLDMDYRIIESGDWKDR